MKARGRANHFTLPFSAEGISTEAASRRIEPMSSHESTAVVVEPQRHDSQARGGQMRIERGPDWLFVRLDGDARRAAATREPALADGIWEALQENHAHRVLLELDQVAVIDDNLIATITSLASRIRSAGGLMRLCGLSEVDLRTLRARGAANVAHFDSRAAAVGAPRQAGVS
jgi:anti-anti-sigma regulatory factor